jgi:hypothetical protein
MPRYKCKSIAALDIALGGLPAKMQVEADVGTGVSAKTVGELRKVTTWSENLVIITPQERHPESAVKISKRSDTHLAEAVARMEVLGERRSGGRLDVPPLVSEQMSA